MYARSASINNFKNSFKWNGNSFCSCGKLLDPARTNLESSKSIKELHLHTDINVIMILISLSIVVNNAENWHKITKSKEAKIQQ